MISLLLKHLVYECTLDVFFHAVHKNIMVWKARDIALSNVKKYTDSKTGCLHYTTYYEGNFIESKISLEVINDVRAMNGIDDIDLDNMMRESLQFEAQASVVGYENIRV